MFKDIAVVTGVPQTPTHCALVAEKSVPTLNVAVAAVGLLPAVVLKLPAGLVLV